jgi:hypothetical protein
MTLSLTCNGCGEVMTADTEEELAEQGQAHGKKHGHDKPMSRPNVLARIRRHNPRTHS